MDNIEIWENYPYDKNQKSKKTDTTLFYVIVKDFEINCKPIYFLRAIIVKKMCC